MEAIFQKARRQQWWSRVCVTEGWVWAGKGAKAWKWGAVSAARACLLLTPCLPVDVLSSVLFKVFYAVLPSNVSKCLPESTGDRECHLPQQALSVSSITPKAVYFNCPAYTLQWWINWCLFSSEMEPVPWSSTMDQRESSEGNPLSPDIVQLIKHRVCISPAVKCIFLPLCSPPTVRNVDAFPVQPSIPFRPEKWLLFPSRLWRTTAKKK